jgi:hypothetical protein
MIHCSCCIHVNPGAPFKLPDARLPQLPRQHAAKARPEKDRFASQQTAKAQLREITFRLEPKTLEKRHAAATWQAVLLLAICARGGCDQRVPSAHAKVSNTSSPQASCRANRLLQPCAAAAGFASTGNVSRRSSYNSQAGDARAQVVAAARQRAHQEPTLASAAADAHQEADLKDLCESQRLEVQKQGQETQGAQVVRHQQLSRRPLLSRAPQHDASAPRAGLPLCSGRVHGGCTTRMLKPDRGVPAMGRST